MTRLLLALATLALYLLHQDFWFWRDGTLVFGVMPVGLFYHALYCIACAGLMWGLVKFAWPASAEATAGKPAHIESDQQPATNNQQPK